MKNLESVIQKQLEVSTLLSAPQTLTRRQPTGDKKNEVSTLLSATQTLVLGDILGRLPYVSTLLSATQTGRTWTILEDQIYWFLRFLVLLKQ